MRTAVRASTSVERSATSICVSSSGVCEGEPEGVPKAAAKVT
jgi:hypothetical protein